MLSMENYQDCASTSYANHAVDGSARLVAITIVDQYCSSNVHAGSLFCQEFQNIEEQKWWDTIHQMLNMVSQSRQ